MRIVIADCSATYSGRGDTKLPRGIRSIIIKADSSVSIHNDNGNKPLNYMKTAVFTKSFNKDDEEVWNFDTRRENLSITLHEILSETEYDLVEDDPGLIRDGTEDQLQEWLSNRPEIFGPEYDLVSREYPTGNGPVDLLFTDDERNLLAVEVKRVAMIGAVDQIRRYIDALKEQETHTEGLNIKEIRGAIAALDIRPKTVEYAQKHNIALYTITPDWNNETEKTMTPSLTEEHENLTKQTLF